jgi:glucokinase
MITQTPVLPAARRGVALAQDSPVDCAFRRVLIADIGATNARFAVLSNGALGVVRNFSVAEFPSFSDVIRAFFGDDLRSVSEHAAILAVAGPVQEGRCVLTNCPWTIDPHELRRELGFAAVELRNDFEAVALSLPHLTEADVFPVGDGKPFAGAPMAVLGPGTGLGVAGLVPGSQAPVVLPSEGGHTTMAGTSRREDAIIDYLRDEFGHVSAERVISGSGLENLYRAVVAIDQIDAPQRAAPDITRMGVDGTCRVSRMALELFCAMLGTVAGNVALMFGARGGVFVAGGIAPRMTDFIARSEFRSRFESKGRFRAYLQSIPTRIIIHPAATFIGLRAVAQCAPGSPVPPGGSEP